MRAATCALNASLVPLLRDLMVSLRRALSSLGVQAPVMVVRGDGSLMRVEMAMDRPVETILSGPASSVVGARALAGLKDMLVVDIGGTTTDLAVVRNGLPLLNRRGATVGRWRTLVRAVQTVSSGLGGDSQVTLEGGAHVRVGPRRAVPLAFAAHAYPQVRDMLGESIERASRLEPAESRSTLRRDRSWQHHVAGGGAHLEALTGDRSRRLATRPWVLHLSNPNRLESTGVVVRCGLRPLTLHTRGEFARLGPEASAGLACWPGTCRLPRAGQWWVLREVRDGWCGPW